MNNFQLHEIKKTLSRYHFNDAQSISSSSISAAKRGTFSDAAEETARKSFTIKHPNDRMMKYF